MRKTTNRKTRPRDHEIEPDKFGDYHRQRARFREYEGEGEW